MQHVKIKDLKENKKFTDRILWDFTPKIFFEPRFPETDKDPGNVPDAIEGYMLYVDVIYNKPGLVIMNVKYSFSKTVAYIEDVPEDLLKDAAQCSPKECVSGMYPLTKKLKDWLKKELLGL